MLCHYTDLLIGWNFALTNHKRYPSWEVIKIELRIEFRGRSPSVERQKPEQGKGEKKKTNTYRRN